MGVWKGTAALLVGAAVAATTSLPAHAYTSPEDRYKQATSRTERLQVQAHVKYRVDRTPKYVTSLKVSRGTEVGPPSPKWEPPPVSRQSTDSNLTEPATPRAGESADVAWVMSVLRDHGLDPKGSTWTVDGTGRCGPLKQGKWAGCTRMSSPASVKINPAMIGSREGAFVVVHEWVHAVERNRDECATDARAREITGLDLHPYDC